LESESKEIPLDFFSDSSSDDSEDSDDDSSSESDESLELVESKNSGECPATTDFPEPDSDSDENGTCPMTFPTSTTDDSEVESVIELAVIDTEIEKEAEPEIEIQKEVVEKDSDSEEEIKSEGPTIKISQINDSYEDDSSSSSSSSEEVDMIIMPFLEVDDLVVLKELDMPFADDDLIAIAHGDSNEITFNLIDSNDLIKHEEDAIRPDKDLEDSFIQKQFSRLIDSIWNIFEF
jgi:hypothetical protein